MTLKGWGKVTEAETQLGLRECKIKEGHWTAEAWKKQVNGVIQLETHSFFLKKKG